jgi:hypothetical protein
VLFPTQTRPIAVSVFALVGMLGCKGEAPEQAAKPSEPEGIVEPAQPVEPKLDAVMTGHFAEARALEQAVIDGDLEAVATHAKQLGETLAANELPESWRPHVAAMQAAAGEAGEAGDLVAAAMATGRVVGACGACHAALDRGPQLAEPSPVPEGEDGKARMLRHQWAAERMREGMIVPSDQRWQLGAAAVSVAPPEPCPIESAEILPPEVLQLRETIYEIGAKAAKTEDFDDRVRVYGEYLTTCAGCHVGGC